MDQNLQQALKGLGSSAPKPAKKKNVRMVVPKTPNPRPASAPQTKGKGY